MTDTVLCSRCRRLQEKADRCVLCGDSALLAPDDASLLVRPKRRWRFDLAPLPPREPAVSPAPRAGVVFGVILSGVVGMFGMVLIYELTGNEWLPIPAWLGFMALSAIGLDRLVPPSRRMVSVPESPLADVIAQVGRLRLRREQAAQLAQLAPLETAFPLALPAHAPVQGTARRYQDAVPTFLGKDSCLAAGLEILGPQGRLLLRSLRACGFLFVDGQGTTTHILGEVDLPEWVRCATDDEGSAVTEELLRELGIPAHLSIEGVAVERMLRDGDSIRFAGGEESREVRPASSGYRDEISLVRRGVPGNPVVIEILPRPGNSS